MTTTSEFRTTCSERSKAARDAARLSWLLEHASVTIETRDDVLPLRTLDDVDEQIAAFDDAVRGGKKHFDNLYPGNHFPEHL